MAILQLRLPSPPQVRKGGSGGGGAAAEEEAPPPLGTRSVGPGCLLYGSPGKDEGTGRGPGCAEDHSHTPTYRGRARRGYEQRLTAAAVEAGRDPWREGGSHDSEL